METQKSHMFRKRKGQSAIEYLMTYGWMLLVVAIVGGAIFATVQGQCAKQSSGFTGTAVTVDSFAATANNLQVVFKNGGAQQVNITNVVLESDGNTVDSNSTAQLMNVGDTAKYVLSQVSSADACNTYDLTVTYDSGEITGATASGTLSANMAAE